MFIPHAHKKNISLLDLLLGAQLVGMTAFLFAAVGGPWVQSGIALAADKLIAVVLPGQSLEGRFNDTTPQAQDKVESRFLLDVVVRKGPSILQLLASEDQTLLIGGNTLLILNLLLHILDGVGRLNLEGDGFTGQRLYEDSG